MPITEDQMRIAQSYQEDAAHDENCRVRVIAGPGTGKSYTIGERIRWLLSSKVNPKTIFVVSFTNAASEKLKISIEDYCKKYNQDGFQDISVSTLHSLGLRSLRLGGKLQFTVEPQVLDDFEVKEIIDKEFSTKHNIPPGRAKNIREDYEAFSSTGKYEPVTYISPNPPITDSERGNFVNYHNPRSLLYSYVLPGEIVRKCVDYMEDGTLEPTNLLRITHFILDEYQDFNPADIEFVDFISSKAVVTFVAGDDDQSIYLFRHANPEGIQNFLQKGQEGDHELPFCFRCTSNILEAGKNIIAAFPHPKRIPKNLTSLYEKSSPPISGNTQLWKFASAKKEAKAIAESCAKLIAAGISPNEIMILLSYTDLQLEMIIPEFNALDIPFIAPKEEKFKDTSVGRFILSLLRIICNSDDFVAYRLILSLLPQVGPKTCNNVADIMMGVPRSYRWAFEGNTGDIFSGHEVTAIKRVHNIDSVIKDWQSDDQLKNYIEDINQLLVNEFGENGKKEWLREIEDLPEDINIREIRDYIWNDNFEQKKRILERVYERLEIGILSEGINNNGVRLFTMHGAKGLDAQIVFIPSLEKEVFPGSKRMRTAGLIYEAARMLYVSITRAKAACILSYAQSRTMFGKHIYTEPSIFISHMGLRVENRTRQLGLSDKEVNEIIQITQFL